MRKPHALPNACMRVVLSATLALGMIPSAAFAEAAALPSQTDEGKEVNEQVQDETAKADEQVTADEAVTGVEAVDKAAASASEAASGESVESMNAAQVDEQLQDQQNDTAVQSGEVADSSNDLSCGKYAATATAYTDGSPITVKEKAITWTYDGSVLSRTMRENGMYVIAGFEDLEGNKLEEAPSVAGEYVMIIQGCGWYTGELRGTLTVTDDPYDISCYDSFTSFAALDSYKAANPSAAIYDHDNHYLTQGKDYEFVGYVSGETPSEIGTYDAVFNGIGRYHGSIVARVRIEAKDDLSIDDDVHINVYRTSYEWTGNPVSLDMWVSPRNLESIDEGLDYELVYFDQDGNELSEVPSDPGTYYMKLRSLPNGQCVGESAAYEITIENPFDLGAQGNYSLNIQLAYENYSYYYSPSDSGRYTPQQFFATGRPVMLGVIEVYYSRWMQGASYSETFELGKDYTVSYVDAEGNKVIPVEVGDYKLVVSAVDGGKLSGKAEVPFSVVETKDLSVVAGERFSLDGTNAGYFVSRNQDGSFVFRITSGFISEAKDIGVILNDSIGRLVEGLDYVLTTVRDGVYRYLTIQGIGKYTGTVRAAVYGKDASEAFNSAYFSINSVPYTQIYGKVCLDADGSIQVPSVTSYNLSYGTDFEYAGCFDAEGNAIAYAAEGDTVYVKINGLGDYAGLTRMVSADTIVDTAPYDITGGKSNFIVRDSVYSDATGLTYLLKQSAQSVGLRVYRTNTVLSDGNGVSIAQTIDNSNSMSVKATGVEAQGYTGETSRNYQLVDKLDISKICSYVEVANGPGAGSGATITDGTFPTMTMQYAGIPFRPNIGLVVPAYSATNCQPTYQCSFINASGTGSSYITGPGTYEVLFAGTGDYEGMITGTIVVTEADYAQLSRCDMKVNGQYKNEYTLTKAEAQEMSVALEYGGTQLTEGEDYALSTETAEDGSVMRITATAVDGSAYVGTKSVVVYVVDAIDVDDYTLCIEDDFGTIEGNGKRYSCLNSSSSILAGEQPAIALIRESVKYPLWAQQAENEVLDPSNYDVQFGDVSNGGTSWVKVTGKNGYKGTKYTSFNVIDIALPKPNVSVSTVPVKLNDVATLSAAVGNASADEVAYEWQGSTDGGKTWFRSGCEGQGTAQLNVRANKNNAEGMVFRCKITVNGQDYYSEAMAISVLAELSAAVTAADPVDGYSALAVSVEGAGFAELVYKWQGSANGGKTWFDSGCAGQGTDTLKVAANSGNAALVFRCVVTAADGRTATSEPTSISLGTPLAAIVATADPVDGYSALTVSVEGAGSAELSYVWQGSADGQTWFRSGCEGQGTAALKVAANKGNAGLVFRCVVTASDGRTVTTEPASISLGKALTATVVAADPVAGKSALTVSVEGAQASDLVYLWQGSADGGKTWFRSGCEGQGTSTLKVAANSGNAALVFRCVVTAADGRSVTTDPVSISLGTPLSILVSSSAPSADGKAELVAAVSGAGSSAITYKWQGSVTNGETWFNSGCEGKDTSTLRVPANAGNASMVFRCVVTTADGRTVTSEPIHIKLS